MKLASSIILLLTLIGSSALAITVNGPLNGAALENIAGTPTAKPTGRIYYDTVAGLPKVCNGTTCTTIVTPAAIVDAIGYTPEDVANKSTATDLGGATPSDTLYPSQAAVKAYADAIPNITELTGDVTANGPGSSAATVAFVGGASAASVANAATLVGESTDANTPSTIVVRDASGNFSAGTISAAITGNVTGDLTGNADTASTADTATAAGKSTNLVGGNGTTLLGSIPYQSNTDTTTLLGPNTTTTKKFLRETGNGTNGAAPAWDTLESADIPNNAADTSGNAATATTATTATTSTDFSGNLSGDVTGTQGATAISAATVTGKLITGFTSGAGAVAATDTVLEAINKLDGNVGTKQDTITANSIDNTELAQMPAHTFKGNNTAGTANADDLTVAELTAELDAVVGDSGAGGTKGLVPAPAAGDAAASKFLKADGTWTSPAGAGDVVGPADSVDSELALFSGTGGKTIKRASGSGVVYTTSGVISNEAQLAIARGGTGAATATAKYAFIGPASGGAAAPSFRALVAGDLPAAVVFSGKNTATNAFAGSVAIFPFTAVVDTASAWASNQYTVPSAGKYTITASITAYSPTTAGNGYAGIYKGTTAQDLKYWTCASGEPKVISLVWTDTYAASDVISIKGWTTSGTMSTLGTVVGAIDSVSIVRIGN